MPDARRRDKAASTTGAERQHRRGYCACKPFGREHLRRIALSLLIAILALWLRRFALCSQLLPRAPCGFLAGPLAVCHRANHNTGGADCEVPAPAQRVAAGDTPLSHWQSMQKRFSGNHVFVIMRCNTEGAFAADACAVFLRGGGPREQPPNRKDSFCGKELWRWDASMC